VPKFKDIENFIDLRRALPFLKGKGWRKFIRRRLEYLFGITGCRKCVVEAAHAKTPDVFGRFLTILNILVDAEGVKETIESIPESSGVLVVANHPYGGADAMAMGTLLIQCRGDKARILANSMVHHIPWSEHIARIAIKANVPVIPIKFFDQNPLWYQIIGKTHSLLRAAFIPRALLMLRNKTIKLRAGAVIDPQTLADAENPTELLRRSVYDITDISH